jgi:hypothetical protein
MKKGWKRDIELSITVFQKLLMGIEDEPAAASWQKSNENI